MIVHRVNKELLESTSHGHCFYMRFSQRLVLWKYTCYYISGIFSSHTFDYHIAQNKHVLIIIYIITIKLVVINIDIFWLTCCHMKCHHTNKPVVCHIAGQLITLYLQVDKTEKTVLYNVKVYYYTLKINISNFNTNIETTSSKVKSFTRKFHKKQLLNTYLQQLKSKPQGLNEK